MSSCDGRARSRRRGTSELRGREETRRETEPIL